MPRLKEKYIRETVPAMKKQFGYTNSLAVPKIKKVVLNIGAGRVLENPNFLDEAMDAISKITGQRPVATKAKKSVASFKIRGGMKIGAKVTLRGNRMYEFLDRLINIAIPRIRDFRGFEKKSFDGRGNFSIGLREQTVFPEIKFEGMEKVFGLEVIINTTAKNDEEAYELLKLLGFPLK